MERIKGSARYVGKGPDQDYHYGIPARDLTAEEVAALDDEQYETIVASAAYELVSAEVAAPRIVSRRNNPSGSTEVVRE